MLISNVLRRIKYHFDETEPYYIVFAVALLAGSCAGAFTVGCLSDSLVSEIGIIMSDYKDALANGFIVRDVVYEGIKNSLTMCIIIYICSFTPLAMASGVLVLAAKGFCIGFAAAGVFKCFTLKNALILLLQSTPYQLLSIAAIFLMAGIGVTNLKNGRTTAQNTMLFCTVYLLNIAGIICEVLIKC
ncbi:MAG: hypothetical protein E7384_03705 [Ruminococcaceae bacterium]|nr:hypothetical protein [Oscillospiraceae bacterium]